MVLPRAIFHHYRRASDGRRDRRGVNFQLRLILSALAEAWILSPDVISRVPVLKLKKNVSAPMRVRVLSWKSNSDRDLAPVWRPRSSLMTSRTVAGRPPFAGSIHTDSVDDFGDLGRGQRAGNGLMS